MFIINSCKTCLLLIPVEHACYYGRRAGVPAAERWGGWGGDVPVVSEDAQCALLAQKWHARVVLSSASFVVRVLLGLLGFLAQSPSNPKIPKP
eukprot:941405-Prorocentrum_minimum.AAC.1